MSRKKFVRLGQKVGSIVVLMLIISVVAVGGLYVSRFHSLTMDMIEDKCVSGTNILAQEMEDAGEDWNGTVIIGNLKSEFGSEFVIFEGQKSAYSTLGGSLSLSDDSRLSGVRSGQSYVGKAKLGGVEYIGSFVPYSDGTLFCGENADEAEHPMKMVIYAVMTVGLVLIVADVLWLFAFMKRNVSIPLGKLTRLAKSLDEGDLGIRSGQKPTLDVHSNDEIGYLAEVMGETMGRMTEYIGEIDGVLQSIADGDLTARVQQSYVGDFVSIKDSLEHILERLDNTMTQIASSSDQVSAGSDQVAKGSQALSQGASEQASAVEELEQTFEAVSEHIQGAARDAAKASEGASRMGQDLTESNSKMMELTEAMEEIKESSDEIEKIIKTIEDIAFQTNILALNAAVEASRAGTAGKGFAVVADEVRSLAAKSGEASKSTAALIERSTKAVERGTRIADETANKISDVAMGAGLMLEDVRRIAEDSETQAGAVTQVKDQVAQISNVVQMNSATAEESAAASEELSNQAELLKGLMERFRLRGAAGAGQRIR